jgi:hypothetical protein
VFKRAHSDPTHKGITQVSNSENELYRYDHNQDRDVSYCHCFLQLNTVSIHTKWSNTDTVNAFRLQFYINNVFDLDFIHLPLSVFINV